MGFNLKPLLFKFLFIILHKTTKPITILRVKTYKHSLKYSFYIRGGRYIHTRILSPESESPTSSLVMNVVE